jgi:hypothetical protein
MLNPLMSESIDVIDPVMPCLNEVWKEIRFLRPSDLEKEKREYRRSWSAEF